MPRDTRTEHLSDRFIALVLATAAAEGRAEAERILADAARKGFALRLILAAGEGASS